MKINGPGLPEYKKPYREFQKTVKVGDVVQVTRRVVVSGRNTMREQGGEVVAIFPNAFQLEGVLFPIPYFSVHDWEILPG